MGFFGRFVFKLLSPVNIWTVKIRRGIIQKRQGKKIDRPLKKTSCLFSLGPVLRISSRPWSWYFSLEGQVHRSFCRATGGWSAGIPNRAENLLGTIGFAPRVPLIRFSACFSADASLFSNFLTRYIFGRVLRTTGVFLTPSSRQCEVIKSHCIWSFVPAR